jgi:hypothetical protein
MALLSERIAQARKKVKAILRKKWPPRLSDNAVAAAEDRMWRDSIRKRADTSYKNFEELPDGETVDLHLTRATDEAIVGEALIRALATALDERDGIAQRTRARSRGRQEVRPVSAPQTVVEAGTTVKGQLLSAVTYVSVLVLVLVVYVVERTKQ